MVRHLSPRDFDKEPRQPQLTLVTSTPSGQPPESPESDVPDSVGSLLRRARLARDDKSLEAIAAELRIRPHLLEALENDDFAQLPGVIYASGFLRSYAIYLGLDPVPLVARLKGANPEPAHDAPLMFPEPINDPRIPRRPLVVLAIGLCVVVYGVWYGLSGRSGKLDPVPAPAAHMTESAPAKAPVAPAAPEPSGLEPLAAAPAAPEAPVPVAETSVAATPVAEASAGAAPVVAGPGQILLRASEDSWIRITAADDRIVTERTLKAGESYAVPGRAGYRLLAGNAGGLTIETAGKRYGPLGQSGDVRRNFALEAESIAQSLPAIP